MVLASLALAGCGSTGSPSESRFEFGDQAMGTYFRIVLYGEDEGSARCAAEAALSRIHELEGRLSDWDPGTELSRLSRSTDEHPGVEAEVSDDLYRVLSLSRQVSEQTGGAFDVTVGPFVRLWRRSVRQEELPTPARLEQARDSVGWDQVELGSASRSIRFGLEGVRLDLGGVGKGFALDEAMRVLVSHGYGRALVDGGGDVLVGAPPPGRSGWRVALDGARAVDQDPVLLELAWSACATSGDRYQRVEIDGVIYSHVVDPQTGLGVTHGQAATVVAPTGALADAWASALCVLPAGKGLGLVEDRTWLEARVIGGFGQDDPCESSGLSGMMVDPGR